MPYEIKMLYSFFKANMNILCLRTLLIPRIRTLLKLVQGNGRFNNRIPRSFIEVNYRKVLEAMRTEAEPWRGENEVAVCLSLRLGPVVLLPAGLWVTAVCCIHTMALPWFICPIACGCI